MEFVITTYIQADTREEAEAFAEGIIYPGPVIDTGLYESN